MCGILQDFSLNLSSLWFFCFSCFNFSFSFPCTAIREPENLIAVCITSILYGMSLHSGYLAPVFASACKARRKRDCDSVLKHFDCMSTLDFYHINRFVDGVFSYFFIEWLCTFWLAILIHFTRSVCHTFPSQWKILGRFVVSRFFSFRKSKKNRFRQFTLFLLFVACSVFCMDVPF